MGIDVVLGAHSHSTIPCLIMKNGAGEEVLLASTGTKLANIGQLVITASGNITTGLVSHYTAKDEAMEAAVLRCSWITSY